MLKLAIVFFLISVVAGLLGFTNIAAGTRTIAVLVFGVLLGMLVF